MSDNLVCQLCKTIKKKNNFKYSQTVYLLCLKNATFETIRFETQFGRMKQTSAKLNLIRDFDAEFSSLKHLFTVLL